MDQAQLDRLAQLGSWLNEYGKSIYSTRGGPFLPGNWGGTTFKGSIVYVHITEWTKDKIILPALNNKLVSYNSLTSDPIIVNETLEGIEIEVPIYSRHLLDTIIELHFENPIQWTGVKAVEEGTYGLYDGLLKDL